MWRKSIVLFVVCLACIFSAMAQENFRVLENETHLNISEKETQLSLSVENLTNHLEVKIKLEIISPSDVLVSKFETTTSIKSGKQILPISFLLTEKDINNTDFIWNRLRYEINANNSISRGIISLSEILPEVFELKTFANYVNDDSRYRILVQAFNPVNANTVKDVTIDSQIQIKDGATIKARGKTNDKGYAILDFNLPKFTQYEDLTLQVAGYKNGVTRNLKDELPNRAFQHAILQTDKPIYQPNQTFNMRLLYVNMLNKPVANAELEVEIEGRDEDGDEETVFQEKVTTSRFGLANVTWKIPESAKLGNYQITVKVGDDGPIGYEQIKITRYELPNFYVETESDQKFYLPEQKAAKVEINASYLFGKAVENAKVRIVREVVNYEDKKDETPEISGATDETGKFKAEINLSKSHEAFKPDKWKRFEDLRFTAYITDLTTNRTEQKRFDLRITKEAIHVYLIGDTYRQSQLLPLKYYVSTFYADGTPAACEVEVFERIEEDLDGNKIPAELGKQFAKVKTNQYGIARLNLPLQLDENKEIKLKLIAKDKGKSAGSVENEIDVDERPVIQVETDKMIYRKGESVRVSIASSKRKGTVYVDLMRKFEVLQSHQIKLDNGQAELVLPFDESIKNDVTIYAYFEGEDEWGEKIFSAKKTVVFPTPNNLKIDAKIKNADFRPGEEANVRFRTTLGGKNPAQTALGVLILDRAIEERARSESEFGRENGFLNRNFVSNFTDLLGFNKVFGKFSRYDVENLDLSKEIDTDLELAVEVAYREGDYYEPKIIRSENLHDSVEKTYDPFFKKQIEPINKILHKIYLEKDLFPADENSLREILKSNEIDFASLRDPWGNPFETEFRYNKKTLTIEFWSPGADKTAKTADDLTVFEDTFAYFDPIGKTINSVMLEYNQRTGNFITDDRVLRDEMLQKNIDLDKLRDPWGNPYRFEFLVNRTQHLLLVKTNGANGKSENLSVYQNDDAELWSYSADYFAVTRAKIRESFYKYVTENKTIPHNETELKTILRENGFDLDKLTDAFGRPYYIQNKKDYRLARFYRAEGDKLKAVKQLLVTFIIRSSGKDGVPGNHDDFELISFEGATKEEEIPVSEIERDFSNARRIFRQSVITTPEGAIGGTVTDANGAVIPNAEATVKNALGNFKRTVRSNDEGYFLIQNLPKDVYQLEVSANGFQRTIISNLTIAPSTLTEIDVTLNVGGVTETVEVTVSSDAQVVNTTSSAVSTTTRRNVGRQVNNQPTFTPRVREYFPETLVWQPELITDKKGNAEIKFKFADSLTTWKLYALGLTVSGELGVVEKELKTFQPFFAELDPPKILTEGDEIALPVTVRNYTGKQQKVSLSMAENNWSTLLNGNLQQIDVLPDKSANAIFNFRATSPVKDGKQRVTASAKKEADAIEKPVTVRPNGFENIENQSQLFNESASFKVNFPENAFPKTRQTTLKIYPNLLSHVAESVDGLLKRPYGCGEQTLSSTYPNLLILKVNGKFKNVDEKILKTAQSYLQDGYKRMLNYQTKEGGYSYWGSNPDVALTVYALRFLHDAEEFIEVDEKVVERMQEWLLSQQVKNGSWSDNELMTAYIVRVLSLNESKDKDLQAALKKGLEFLKTSAEKSKDNYVLANIALAVNKIGDRETAKEIAIKLVKFAQPNQTGVFWHTNETPFHGWGTAATIETTALVLQTLLPFSEEKEFDSVFAGGLGFIVKNKDHYGVWHSTQTTVNVLDTLIAIQEKSKGKGTGEKTAIFINGEKVQEIPIDEKSLANPFVLDISQHLEANENTIEIKGTGNSRLTMAQIVSSHFSAWKDAKLDSPFFDLKVVFDKTEAKIGDEITCAVEIERKNNADGMILAEIGIPPAVDVDRNSLERAKAENSLSSYDILPDKIVIYYWAGRGKKSFSFKFKPRYGINALNATSTVYDYYNPEARATIAPIRFTVK